MERPSKEGSAGCQNFNKDIKIEVEFWRDLVITYTEFQRISLFKKHMQTFHRNTNNNSGIICNTQQQN